MTDQELSEACARKLGWTYNPCSENDRLSTWTKPDGTYGGFKVDCPAYSTSIEAAWKLFESKQFYNGGIAKNIWGKWVCSWDRGGGDWITEAADTAPRAICEAFLKLA